MKIEKSLLKDTQGRPLTQGLFLEISYNTQYAVYTLKDEDHEYEGKVYPSLKRLYLSMEDVVEYDFATKYLLGWSHWKRLQENKAIAKHIAEWREELELKLRSQAVRDIIDMTADEKSFQAAKWIADKGWDKLAKGRPRTAEKVREEALQNAIEEDYKDANVISLINRG